MVLNEIEELAIKAKNGDKCAIEELIKKFNPLIYKTSKQICARYGQLFPLDEIIKQSRCILVQVTVLEYQPGGKAHYPYFLKQSLHANLVKLYRPLYTYICKAQPLDDIYVAKPDALEEIFQDERTEICDKLVRYISETCNDREKDLIDNFMMGNIPRNQLAIKYHISFQRMKAIHKQIIKKLRKYLMKLGIRNREDI